ncbi:MAG: PAS domain-containing protein [Gemmatimonadota bacterium]
MTTLHDVQTRLAQHAPDIIDGFNRSTEQEPWIHLPEQERLNFLRNLIEPLTEVALSTSGDSKVYRRALHVAARHGERRHAQGLPEQILFDDLYLFRRAVCSQIECDDGALYAEAVNRIDAVLSLATFASLRGYYRDDFEARHQWPDTIDEIAADWRKPSDISGRTRRFSPVADDERKSAAALLDGYLSGAWGTVERLVGRADETGDTRRAVVAEILGEFAGSLEFLRIARDELDSSRSDPDGELIAVLNGSGTFRYVRPNFFSALGYRTEELVGSTVYEIVHPEDADDLAALLLLMAGAPGAAVRCRFRARHREGSWCALSGELRQVLVGTESTAFVLRAHIDGFEPEPVGSDPRRGTFFKRYLPRSVRSR